MTDTRTTSLLSSPVTAAFLLGASALALITVRDAMLKGAGATDGGNFAEARSGTTASGHDSSHDGSSASIRREHDGHFWAPATVSGVPVRFLLDTGASTVALTREDARRIGIDLMSLPHDVEVRTAGGRTRASTVTLDELSIGDVVLHQVDAVVIEEGLEHSLLGQSFLNRLSGWEVTSGSITLRR